MDKKLRPRDRVVLDGRKLTVVRRRNLKLFTVVIFTTVDSHERVLLPESHLWHLRLTRRLVDETPDLVAGNKPPTIH
jgi:hypothetical protein